MRVVFCGTPEFAVPSLRKVLAAGHSLPLVLAQPDRPFGRKQTMTSPAVKLAALAAGVEVAQPEKLRNNAEIESRLSAIVPDVIVVVAYGRILPPWMLDLPRLGCVNVHGSLLPKYRGAAPVQWAIANGETETGVTTMRLEEGLDTGPMFGSRRLEINQKVTAVDLFIGLASLGAALLAETLTELETGAAHAVPQDDSLATLAPILSREDGRVLWSRTAREIYNRWRGFQPWPGAFAEFRGQKLGLVRMVLRESPSAAAVGTLQSDADRLFVTCGDQIQVELLEVQAAGKRAMSAADFLRGYRLLAGERLT